MECINENYMEEKRFYVGMVIGTTIHIDKVYDNRNSSNVFDKKILYDITVYSKDKKYYGLSFNQVCRVINKKNPRLKIVAFATPEIEERIFNYSDDQRNDSLYHAADMPIKPSRWELELIKQCSVLAELYNYGTIANMDEYMNLDFEFVVEDMDHIAYIKGLDELNILVNEKLDDKDAQDYIDNIYRKKEFLTKHHRLLPGEVIKGIHTDILILSRNGRNKFGKALLDAQDTKTGKIYHNITPRDVTRMAMNDFPIITVDGESKRLNEWSKILGLDINTLRRQYRLCKGDQKKMEFLIKNHINLIKQGKSKYDGTEVKKYNTENKESE